MAKWVVKYVGHKVSKVRWRPQPAGCIEPSDIFASGSWDDMVNSVCIWRFPATAKAEDEDVMNEPELVCAQKSPADIMDLVFLNRDQLICALSDGSVRVFSYKEATGTLVGVREWTKIHGQKGLPSPCTALGVIAGSANVASGGEDGRLNILRLDDAKPFTTIATADSATITGLDCTIPSEVLSSSSNGLLKVWDLRKPPSKPTRILAIESGDYTSINSVSRHPNQPNLVVMGCCDGSLCFWDLRQEKMPASLYHAHTSDVWEAKFHRSYPDHLFTCCQDGSLWHWDVSSAEGNGGSVQRSSWLSGVIGCGKVDIVNCLSHNTLSVNSCDVESGHVVCGTDGEAIFVIMDLNLN